MMLNVHYRLFYLLLFSFSASIISCNAQKKWGKINALQEAEDRRVLLMEKAVDSLSNIFLNNYNDYTLNENAIRLSDSLHNRGMDTLVIYKFGFQGVKNKYMGIYIYTNHKGNTINYELRQDGLYNRNYCTGIYFYFFDIFDSNSFMPDFKTHIYDDNPINQYYYEDVSLIIKGKTFYSFSLRKETYPDEDTYEILNMIKRGILVCFYLTNDDEKWRIRKLSD